LNWTDVWGLAVPPLAGGLIGYFTNDLAITMLFKPYRPVYLGRRRIPFTPGLIPANQSRLGQKVADAILSSLLTPEELQKLARRLLQQDRLEQIILWLLQLAREQLREDHSQRTDRILADLLQDLLGQALPRLLRVLARRRDFLEEPLNRLFDQVLLTVRLSPAQGDRLSEWVFDGLLPPDSLRCGLIDLLTESNIEAIDRVVRDRTSGAYWVIANVFGLKVTLQQMRQYLESNIYQTNALIADLLKTLSFRQRLSRSFQQFSLQSLPATTLRQMRREFRESLRSVIQSQGVEVLSQLDDVVDWQQLAQVILRRLQSSTVLDSSLLQVSQELALLLDRYLEKDLEAIVEQAIPILNLEQLIISKVEATPPEDLEAAIQGIVRSELQAIVRLGGVLGLLIGGLQSLTYWWQHRPG
jgi:uncharacterized membrane protein YheB (UPF0754 family)